MAQGPSLYLHRHISVADEFANHGVKAAQRVRQKNAIEYFNVVAFTTRHHRGNKIAGAVIAKTRRLLPGRAIISAGNMSDMMLEVMFLKPQLPGVDFQRFREQRTHVAHRHLCAGEDG